MQFQAKEEEAQPQRKEEQCKGSVGKMLTKRFKIT